MLKVVLCLIIRDITLTTLSNIPAFLRFKLDKEGENNETLKF
jgi:hypothetical protein